MLGAYFRKTGSRGMNAERQWTEQMKTFAPEGALAYKWAGGADRARWIYDEFDLLTTENESPQLVVRVDSHTTRAEIVAKLLSVGSDTDSAARAAQLAGAIIGDRPLKEVFEVARKLKLTEEGHSWLASECAKLKLRAYVFGVGWVRSAWLEVASQEEGLDRASGFRGAVQCIFFRGDSEVARYRLQWCPEEEPTTGASEA